jgi:hypothetical protein
MTATFDSVFRIYPNAALMVHMGDFARCLLLLKYDRTCDL